MRVRSSPRGEDVDYLPNKQRTGPSIGGSRPVVFESPSLVAGLSLYSAEPGLHAAAEGVPASSNFLVSPEYSKKMQKNFDKQINKWTDKVGIKDPETKENLASVMNNMEGFRLKHMFLDVSECVQFTFDVPSC